MRRQAANSANAKPATNTQRLSVIAEALTPTRAHNLQRT